MAMLELKDLHHFYKKKEVLKGISMQIQKGTVVGLLGPSGAGKTTLINLLTGQLSPSSGSIERERENLVSGIMMDSFGLYQRLSVFANLKIFADLYQVPSRRIDGLLDHAGLSAEKKTPVSALSKGMRNRVNLCRALLKECDILYLDEPTSGLDPTTTEKIHSMIEAEKEKGTTIFLTTHNMYEAEKLCDNIFLLDHGTIIEHGTPSEICRRHNTSQTILLTAKDGKVYNVKNEPGSADFISRMILSENVISLHTSEPNLETVFLSLTGRKLDE